YANALDWQRPPRNMIQTAYWYLNSSQYRYDTFAADALSASGASGAEGRFAGMTTADLIAPSARMGGRPSYPTADRKPLGRVEEPAAADQEVRESIPAQLKSGGLRSAAEDPDAPENFPRVRTTWRPNLLGSSAKGNQYFLNHLLGTDS